MDYGSRIIDGEISEDLSLQHELRARVKRVEEHDRRNGSARIRKRKDSRSRFVWMIGPFFLIYF